MATPKHLVSILSVFRTPPLSQVEHLSQSQDILMWLEARFGRDTHTLCRQEFRQRWNRLSTHSLSRDKIRTSSK